jgi:hydroxymethylglutaryl-CoA reductase (NADPH)
VTNSDSIEMCASFAAIPMQWVGPVRLKTPDFDEEVSFPLATFESPLWPSVRRGALAAHHAGGISALITHECMSRSLLVEGPSAERAFQIKSDIELNQNIINEIIQQTSRFIRFQQLHIEQVGRLLFIRLSFTTGDASGHNMTTLAADAVQQWLLNHYIDLQYVSISGNYCTDKKVSAVNGILGRGKRVIADVRISRAHCRRFLKTTPEKICDLVLKKNLVGGVISGSLRTANAHFANMLLAFYLATGQDAANIVEGSQGLALAEVIDDNLYFSVTLPHVIVGTVGNGKNLPFVQQNLARLGCDKPGVPGKNAARLALMIGAAVLCGELSLLAAQTNPGELMKSHVALERQQRST